MNPGEPLWRRLLRPSARSIRREVDEEIRFHLETRVAELERQVWSPEDARNEAIRRFGDPRRTRDLLVRADTRRERKLARQDWFQDAYEDVVFAIRQLRGSPGF